MEGASNPSSHIAQDDVPIADGYNEYQPLKKQKLSKVWDDFEKILGPTPDQNTAKCKHCKIVLTAGPRNGTSHLHRHIDRCAKKVHSDITQYMFTGDISENGTSILTKPILTEIECRKLVMMHLIEDTRSFLTVELGGFRKLVKGLYPPFKHFSRHTASRELFKMYVKERENVKDFIMSAPGKVAMTTDNWKNTHTNEEYICVTTHFIDSNWILQKRILRFHYLVPPYDATCISDEIILFLGQWNLEHKLLCFTTDNASYTRPMVNNIKRHVLLKSSLVDGGSFFHIRCCAHILNLIVQARLNSIAIILVKIRNMVKAIDRVSVRKTKFMDIAEKNFKLHTKKRFRLDMPVRWNSTYTLLDRVLFYKDVFIYFGERDLVIQPLIPLVDEWEKVIYVHKFLKTFYDVTNMFSASKYPTANNYVKGVWKIQLALIEVARDPQHFLVYMIRHMQAKFDKYWGEYNLVLSCATILDPRYKITFMKYCFVKVYGIEVANARVEKVMNTIKRLFEEYRRMSIPSMLGENVGSSTGGVSLVSDNCDPELDDYDTYYTQERAQAEFGKSELDLYLEEPNHPRNVDLDVLDFWFTTSGRFPTLALMARDILTIPVSTVASESAFSIGGKTISSTRSSLKPKTVQALICLRDWMLSLGEGEDTLGNDESGSSSEDEEGDKEEDN